MADASDHPLYPVALGVVAYGLFVQGQLDEADRGRRSGRSGNGVVRVAHRWVGRADASRNALFFQQHEAEALVWMNRMQEAAQATGAPGLVVSRLLHAIGGADVGR